LLQKIFYVIINDNNRKVYFRAYDIGHFMAIQEISIVASMGSLEISTVSRAGAIPLK
jgi:hypothetical protein